MNLYIITLPIAVIIFLTLRSLSLRPPKSWLEPHDLQNHNWDFPPVKRPREEGDSTKELWSYSTFLAMTGSFVLLMVGCCVALVVGLVMGGWGSVAGASLIVGSFLVFMRLIGNTLAPYFELRLMVGAGLFGTSLYLAFKAFA